MTPIEPISRQGADPWTHQQQVARSKSPNILVSSHHFCGAQGTFYLGNLKGVGRVYQTTFIDTYAKFACAKIPRPSQTIHSGRSQPERMFSRQVTMY